MDLENRAFEKNAKESMKTISDLKQSLDFSGSAKGLNELEAASRDFQMGGLGNAVEQVKLKFSALEIAGITALVNITNQAVNTGKRLISSLTIDQITSGFQKYADKTSAVQTIMAATRQQFTDTGKQMEYVNEQLDRLNWFTDETSYNFVDMVGNIGKFTSNNIALDKAATSMQGIAAWAAISGANAGEASRAMYNLSQAIATGTVKLIDWKSIENANMATAEFKQNAIDAAVALGTLKKTGDGLYETLEGNAVSVSNFNENLQDAWFTSDVLLNSLDKYGGFSVQLGKEMDALGDKFLTSEILDFVDKYEDGSDILHEAAKRTGADWQTLNDAVWRLRQPMYDLGRRAFRAAQEAKTFQEAIDATKDAVSTGWMKTFELIFGNYEQAKELWTGLSEVLWDVFAAGGEERNKLLQGWSKNGGREALINGLTNALDALLQVIETVKSAWRNVFPEKTSSQLVAMTRIFERFTEGLALTDNEASGLERVLTVLFGVIRVGWNVFKDILKVGGAILSWVVDLARSLLDLAGGSDKAADSVSDFAKKVRNFSVLKSLRKVIDVVSTALNKAKDAIVEFVGSAAQLDSAKQLASNFLYLVDAVKKFASVAWDWIVEKISAIGKIDLKKPKDGMTVLTTIADNLFKALNKLFDIFKNLGESFSKWFKQLTEPKEGEQAESIFTKISDSADEMYKNVADSATGSIKDYILAGFTNLGATLEEAAKNINFGRIFTIIKDGVMAYFVYNLATLTKTAKKGISQPITSLQDITKAFKGVLVSLSTTIKDYGKNLRANTILKLAISIGILAAALAALSFIPADRLADASATMLVLAGVLALIMKAYDRIASIKASQSVQKLADGIDIIKQSLTNFLSSIASSFKIIATAFAISTILVSLGVSITLIVTAIKSLAKATEKYDIQGAVWTVIAIILALGGAMAAIGKFNTGSFIGAATAILAMGVSMNLIVAALKNLQEASGKANYISTVFIIIGIMEAMAVAINVADSTRSSGKGFIKMALAIGIIGMVIKSLAESTGNIGGATLAVDSIMALFLVLAHMSTMINPTQMKAMSTGFLKISIALGVIMVALLAFGKRSSDGLKGIGLLAAALIVLAGAGALITALGLAPSLYAISVAFQSFGATALKVGAMFALIGLGITLIAKGFGAFGPAMDQFVAGWVAASEKISASKEVLTKGMIDFIDIMISGILGNIAKIAALGNEIIKALVYGIVMAIPQIVDAAVALIEAFLGALSNNVQTITDMLFNILVSAINALANSIRSYGGALLAAISNVVSALLELILRALAGLIDALPGGDWLAGKMRGWADGLEKTATQEIPGMLGVVTQETHNETAKVQQAMMEDGVKIQEAGENMLETGLGNLGPKAKQLLEGQGISLDGLLGDGTEQGFPKTEAALNNLLSTTEEKLGGVVQVYSEKGEQAPSEFAAGIFAGVDKAKNAATQTGQETEKALETASGGGGRVGGRFVNEYSAAIAAGTSQATSAASQVGASAASTFNKSREAWSAGDFTTLGFIQGILNRLRSGEVGQAGANVASAAIHQMRNIPVISSPSKVTFGLGDFVTLGWIYGILNRKKEAGLAGAQVAQESCDMMNATILRAMDTMSNTSEFQPTIRPVVDLTDISNGASAISSMLGGNRAMALGASVRLGMSDDARYSELASMMSKRDTDIRREFSDLNGNIRELIGRIDDLELRMDGDDIVAGLSGKFSRNIGRTAAMKQRGM